MYILNAIIRVSLCTISFSLATIASSQSTQIQDFWYAGAEISRFTLDQNRYGEQHVGHAEFIFVTEPFLLQQQVKHEHGDGPATDVLKLNALRTFNTGLYSYRTMTSTFQPVDYAKYPQALKSTTSIQDWCGQAYQQINRIENGWQLRLHSYFQDTADRSEVLTEAYLEDALWLLLRLDPTVLPLGTIQIVPGALYTAFAHQPAQPQVAEARLQQDALTSLYCLDYPDLSRQLEIEFDNSFPHIIRSWREIVPSGTTTAVLQNRIMNSNYWLYHQPQHGHLRQDLGLEAVAD